MTKLFLLLPAVAQLVSFVFPDLISHFLLVLHPGWDKLVVQLPFLACLLVPQLTFFPFPFSLSFVVVQLPLLAYCPTAIADLCQDRFAHRSVFLHLHLPYSTYLPQSEADSDWSALIWLLTIIWSAFFVSCHNFNSLTCSV